MHFYKALLLASISKTFADPLASEFPAPDFSLFSTTGSDNPDWNARPLVDSGLVTISNTGNSASSDSKDRLSHLSPNNEIGLNIGSTPNSIAAVNTDISNSECGAGNAHTSNPLRTRQQCLPLTTDDEEVDPYAKADADDLDWVEKNPNQDNKDAWNLCAQIRNLIAVKFQLTPVCCRGPVWTNFPFQITFIHRCVEYITGRPRCRSFRERYCCWMLGEMVDEKYKNLGKDCRPMFEEDAIEGAVN